MPAYLERAHKDRDTGSLVALPAQDHLKGCRAYAKWRVNMSHGCFEDLVHNGVCLLHVELASIKQLASGLQQPGLE